jgi:hypothetical protein
MTTNTPTKIFQSNRFSVAAAANPDVRIKNITTKMSAADTAA